MSKDILKEVQDHLEALEEGLKQGETGALMALLEKMPHFHRYSPVNALLIYLQKPEATLVAGIMRWNELGRRVKKGEKAIRIRAPIVETQEELLPDGRVERKRRVVGFRTAFVFDISQTEGKPLAMEEPRPELQEIYGRLKEACPFPVEEKPLPVMGYTDGSGIAIASYLPDSIKAEVLLHEWAHALLHYDGAERPKEVVELEAEATAYAAGRTLGLPMEQSRDYILAWQGTEGDLKGVTERILRAATRILRAVLGKEEPEPSEADPREELVAA